MNVQERQALVRDFHRKSGEPINNAPEPPDNVQAVLRAKFVLEEAFELVESLGVQVELTLNDEPYSGEVIDVYFGRLEFCASGRQPDLVRAVDALRDVEYQLHGTELVLGVTEATDDTFLEVHRSNMEKQIVDYGEKAVKPPGWKPPQIAEVLRRTFPKKALLFRK
jgi:predicted HAD superfamily Cof-like phosphohydrolase